MWDFHLRIGKIDLVLIDRVTRTGVDFTNVLQAAFTHTDPKSAKSHWWFECLFYAFGICARKGRTLSVAALQEPLYNSDCDSDLQSKKKYWFANLYMLGISPYSPKFVTG